MSWIAELTAARARDSRLYIHVICTHPRCPARDLRLRVLDYDEELVALAQRRGGVHCPACGRRLTCDVIRTQIEQYEDDAREARCSVNGQLYERDHGPGVPLSVLSDDRLPSSRADDEQPF
jgi:hypothetical protein